MLTWERTVDAYRNKMRNTMVSNGQDVNATPHFITRPGKTKWLARNKRTMPDDQSP